MPDANQAARPPRPPSPGEKSPRQRRQVKISLATLVAVVSLATGVFTLKDQLFGGSDDGPVVVVRDGSGGSGEIPRFDGIAGHLEESRALLDFLDQHDDETVYLEVGFPKLATPGPVSGDNVVAEDVVNDDGSTSVEVRNVSLMTKCEGVDPGVENPTVTDGCSGTSLDIQGSLTEDAHTFFEHGVPVFKGYFKVDVTGGLHMGLSPVLLRPLTFEQATQQ